VNGDGSTDSDQDPGPTRRPWHQTVPVLLQKFASRQLYQHRHIPSQPKNLPQSVVLADFRAKGTLNIVIGRAAKPSPYCCMIRRNPGKFLAASTLRAADRE